VPARRIRGDVESAAIVHHGDFQAPVGEIAVDLDPLRLAMARGIFHSFLVGQ
jgi:hypothetical protein